MKSETDEKPYGELTKYYDMLRQGNMIAARLHQKIISEHSAKALFIKMIEDLTKEVLKDNKK
jgi:hypothetical protein